MLTVKQVAKKSKMTPRNVQYAIKSGALTAINYGNMYLVSEDDYEKWIEDRSGQIVFTHG